MIIDSAEYKKARIYTTERIFIGEANLYYVYEDTKGEIALRVPDEVMDSL